MKIYKKRLCALLLLAGAMTTTLFAQRAQTKDNRNAQQITRIGVVDMKRVYEAVGQNASAVQRVEAKRAEFQAEIDRQTEELKALQSQKAELEQAKDAAGVRNVNDQIRKQAEALSRYSTEKSQELETLQKGLQQSDAFYTRLHTILGKVAESEGFTMIMSLQESSGILWFSPTVDVTGRVIAGLR
jgi:outer membrane protein